jgi:transcriptional regulator with XRE-family HTH domain
VGEAIRTYRKRAGLSQEKLAENVDLNPKYLSEVERGRANISLDALARLAKSLKIRLRDLVAEV